eukprot:TRINITY_DN26204_c0_g1_i2.p1 TRINITY_DN26204_c0_g1~~TRINITY_DN26204_c0_g1_i2.p1  ORF type:complete len:390 (+),score=84.56 TRINITY_DN26204_c0_g1_i2:500-1669(+)
MQGASPRGNFPGDACHYQKRGGSAGGDRDPVRLPPLPRPPSADDVNNARRHLVLLKARMGSRTGSRGHGGIPRYGSVSAIPADRRGGEPSGQRAASASPGPNGRGGSNWQRGQSVPPMSRGSEEARPRSRGQEASPRAAVAFPGNQGGAPTDEQGGDDVELVKCDDCGRKFAPDRLEKHQKICRKVFMEKRKKFDSAANRLDHFENAQELIHGAKKIEHEVKAKEAQAEVPAKGLDKNGGAGAKEGKEKPMPAWKKKSLEFRAAMLAQKVQEGDDADAKEKLNELKKELATAGPSDAVDPGMVKCPNCGRTFNKESGERHMNICKAKPAARLQKAGGGAGGAAGRDASKSRTEAPPTAAGGRSSGVAARPGGPAAAPAARRSNSVGQRR